MIDFRLKIRASQTSDTHAEQAKNISLISRIAPSSLSFEGVRVNINGTYRRHVGIRSFAYHNKVGWLDALKTLPASRMTIFVKRANTDSLISSINRTDTLASVKSERANSASRAVLANAEQAQAIDMMGMLAERDKTFLTCDFIASAEDENDEYVRARVADARRSLLARGIEVDDLALGQEAAFRVCDPLASLDDSYLVPRFQCALDTDALAAMQPFDECGMVDACGTELGTDANGALVRTDLLNPRAGRTNMNMAAVGKPGKGKSHLLKLIACSDVARGARVIWLDFEQEAKKLCRELSGQYLNCSDKGVRLSPLQYRTTSVEFDDDGEAGGDETVEVLRSTIQFLGGFYQLAFGISKNDLPLLYKGLEEAYAAHGVTYATGATDIDMSDYPTMDEVAGVFDRLAESEVDAGRKSTYLALASHSATGGKGGLYGNFWGGKTDINLDSDFIVFDLSSLTNAVESVRNAQLYSILSFVWSEVCKSRVSGIPLRLVLDEAHMLLGNMTDTDTGARANPVSASMIATICRRARKFNCAVSLSTQSLSDFTGGGQEAAKFAKSSFETMTYTFVFGMDDWRLAADLLQIPSERARALPTYGRGRCIFKVGTDEMIDLHVRAADELMPWIGKAGGR